MSMRLPWIHLISFIFCDVNAYDAGNMTPDDMAGRVKVVRRGGTRFQLAVDFYKMQMVFPRIDRYSSLQTDGLKSIWM